MSLLSHRTYRSWAIQTGTLLAIISALSFFLLNAYENLRTRGIHSGFRFLKNTAGFPIAETFPIPVSIEVWFTFFGLVGGIFILFILKRMSFFKKEFFLNSAHRTFYVSLGILLCAILSGFLIALRIYETPSEQFFKIYEPSDSYWLAFATGIFNTLKVSTAGIFFSFFLGIGVGFGRASNIRALSIPAASFINLMRNIPLLLHLMFWYVFLLKALPNVQDGFTVAGMAFLNNRGMFLPSPVFDSGFSYTVVSSGIVILATFILRHHNCVFKSRMGKKSRFLTYLSRGMWIIPLIVFLSTGKPINWEFPEIVFAGRNIAGGLALTPEFVALFIGLSTYTSAFIAEIFHSGLKAVYSGQIEAANALGLSKFQAFRLVIFPQALQVMIPPLASQFLNLTKNSSLAVAIGYPDVVGIGGTVLNQAGQAVEVILLWMAVYLLFSLIVSAVLNLSQDTGWRAKA